jgi:CBS-domain-containing membrane protein
VVEDTEHIKLVGSVTERNQRFGVTAGDRRTSKVRVEKIIRPLFACCGASKTDKETRRKLHAHRVTSLPVADKAGGYL